ncbi:hypothetical protein LTR66_010729 [Elasticomyces elasticus]|nr:hypothetical protein LTR66_010729 [Elasticomyces elasticus]
MSAAPDTDSKFHLPTTPQSAIGALPSDHASHELGHGYGNGGNNDTMARTTIAQDGAASAVAAAAEGSAVTSGAEGGLEKPKQKRNKPTLSCEECVERKTKCDRGRPACLACVKRLSRCQYTQVANLIASADRKHDGNAKARFITKPQKRIKKGSMSSDAFDSPSASDQTSNFNRSTRASRSSSGSSPFLLSHLPYSKSTPSNVFGIGSQHPFSNYWTCQGGLPEVIGVLPSKDQADILIARYFECVDPVYPFLHRRTFYANYERFWAASIEAKGQWDAATLALHYAMYSLGTQFIQFPSYNERTQTAEFYASAANQSLRIYSYLNRTSMHAIQAMLLMAYFLMNDNHASDAYAWAGIHLRQAYAMRLHRDPDVIMPTASPVEKQQRRKLWQAVFFQDTFLTVLLKLPPTATHSDVTVESLTEDTEVVNAAQESFCSGNYSRVEHLMSISVIAPSPDTVPPPPPPLPGHTIDPAIARNDIAYIRSMWRLGNFVQENLSSPLSLSLPLASSPRQKTSLLSSFRSLYKSFPLSLTTLDYAVLQQQALHDPRGVRQNLFLTSNYYHCLMLLQASDNEPAGVECNVKGALEAGHEAIWAFFKLWGLFEVDAGVWWVFQHRAFEEALTIASLLSTPRAPDSPAYDPIFAEAKDDIHKMLELLDRSSGSLEMQKTRIEHLRDAYGQIVF